MILRCKISKVTYGFSSGNRVYTATYTGNNLTELKSTVDKVVFTYNSNGQIVEQRNWDLYNNNLIYTGKETYQYDGTKLIEITDYSSNNTTIDDKTVLEWTGTIQN